ncbi:hypothetical protein E1A91_D06G212300v1 [Gossypium mustelinum]|uniref:DC1 domain-containing protein n=1 Tax=Gossypium mustelinum TaxID=34275 RepID=A0A5D2UNW8_GOSMU|nr:hypothetical protein E1A91_D06G212300v1 [Gossypium mustelinum]
MEMKNEESVSENQNKIGSVSENKNKIGSEVENESVSESKNENENETESENEIENESVSESESEIENESVSERESVSESGSESVSESENESHDKSVQQIQHPFHEEHPLVLVAEQSNEGLKAYCDRRGELLSTPCFTCIHCNYHLHKHCAKVPLKIFGHPLHLQHPRWRFLLKISFTLFLRQRPHEMAYGCALCKEKRKMFFYQCHRCWFSIDIKCAQLSSSFKFSLPFKLDIHNHALTFIESPIAIDVLKRFSCSWCHKPLTNDISFCSECPFFILHKKCLDELPTKINHPSYHVHPIFLNRSDTGCFCNLYQKQHSGPFYGCTLFQFNINIGCALPMSIVEGKSSFICDACGTEGNYISYICSTCNVMVHKNCTSLPRIIKFSRHDHCIFHKYFLEDLARQDCNICFNEVKLDRGSYSCGKPGCNYIVHVNCVLEDDHLYKVIEEGKQCEEPYKKSMQSSIIRVIEVNEAGEATKIEHFSHQHCLVLADKMEEEIDRKCDGIKQHWFRQSNAILNFKGFLECNFCCRPCSGFFYNIGEYLRMCLMRNVMVVASGVGMVHSNVETFHKIDEHMLNLTYDDDKEQSYCDVCEQERDPTLWYYSCSICDTSAHPKCVLGQFPFLKDGITWAYADHSHTHHLKFFRNAEGYPECSRCGKLCQEEILKCEESTCNYIIHCKCRDYQV